MHYVGRRHPTLEINTFNHDSRKLIKLGFGDMLLAPLEWSIVMLVKNQLSYVALSPCANVCALIQLSTSLCERLGTTRVTMFWNQYRLLQLRMANVISHHRRNPRFVHLVPPGPPAPPPPADAQQT